MFEAGIAFIGFGSRVLWKLFPPFFLHKWMSECHVSREKKSGIGLLMEYSFVESKILYLFYTFRKKGGGKIRNIKRLIIKRRRFHTYLYVRLSTPDRRIRLTHRKWVTAISNLLLKTFFDLTVDASILQHWIMNGSLPECGGVWVWPSSWNR